jgi:hypothetical protein
LSELPDEVAREPMQVEVSAVRVLFELLGLLLGKLSAIGGQLSVRSIQNERSFRRLWPLWPGRPDRSARFRLQWGELFKTS